MEDVGTKKGDGPSNDDTNEEVGIDVEDTRNGKDTSVEENDAEFDKPDCEDAQDQNNLHILFMSCQS